MTTIKTHIIFTFIAMAIIPFKVNAQLSMTVNSLADDQYAYAWDNPATPQDESRDGICNDELGRCTIRAAIDESNNMDIPLDLGFSVSGSIDLIDVLYPVNGSIINGGQMVELTGGTFTICFDLGENTEIAGLSFNNVGTGIIVNGSTNKIGGLLNGNVFTNCTIGLEIWGDDNEVVSNYFGIDRNKVLKPNQMGLLIYGSQNKIGRSVATYSNTICGNSIAGITIGEGSYNKIMNNFIGTTSAGDLGLGNTQGILIAGSIHNTIGGDNNSDRNVISGNSVVGIAVTGVPPDNNSDATLIKNNIIGLDGSQTFAIANGTGITFTNAVWTSFINSNVIAGNLINGIHIFGYDTESRNTLNNIENNRIGINSSGNIFPNGTNGILVSGNVDLLNIGTDEGGSFLPNTIVGNSGSGIRIETEFGFSPTKIVFRKNKIYQNNTGNLFVSSQANNGLLPPYSLSFNNNTIAGIHDVPGAIIDVYKANINEFSPSAYVWLGSTIVGSNSVFSYEITDPSIEAVSLTATTSTGNTSGFAFIELITAVEKENDEIPSEFSLKQNYPNPFNPATTINFLIPKEEFVSLKVFNSLGEEVTELVNEAKSAGNYSVLFNAEELPSGIYFYKITAGSFFETRKMILVK